MSDREGYTPILSFLVVGVAPVAIAASIWRRRLVDIQTILGAISIYVFIGMFFAFVYQAVGVIGSEPFFAQQKTATIADYLYFSFVTLTTTGYGDLTAAGGLGRALAVSEALFGQVYLVTVIALLISQFARRRHPNTDADS
jgi:voltage-gated potassium channel Kch